MDGAPVDGLEYSLGRKRSTYETMIASEQPGMGDETAALYERQASGEKSLSKRNGYGMQRELGRLT